MTPNFRRGIDAMDSGRGQSGSRYPAFAPNIRWVKDGEEKFILFLNPAEDIYTVDLHEWIEVGTTRNGKTRYESFISRKDEAIGEDYDDIQDRLGRDPRTRTIAVAVELEPTFETIKGRKRPKGFEVKTETYEQRTEDDDTEEVTAPVVGLVIQAKPNFFGWIGSFNETTAPIEETPLQVIRRGDDKDTMYATTPYLDLPVDFTNLIENYSGVGYLRSEADEIALALEDETEEAKAMIIGRFFLDKRINELADEDRYKELIGEIDELPPSRFQREEKKSEAKPKVRDNGAERPRSGPKFSKLRAAVENSE